MMPLSLRYRFTAEILDNGKPGGEIEGMDFGAEKPCSCNPGRPR